MKDTERVHRQNDEMESLATTITNNGAMLDAARDLVARQISEYQRLRQVYIDTRAASIALQAASVGPEAVIAEEVKRAGLTG